MKRVQVERTTKRRTPPPAELDLRTPRGRVLPY